MFSISSSSSSSDSNQNEDFDHLVDDFVTNHLPLILIPQNPPQESQPINDINSVLIPRGDREREKGHLQLFNDYFENNPVYNENQFCRRFRMKRPLFCHIMSKVVEGDQFFQQRRNAARRLGLSPLQKCTAAIRMLAYGLAPDVVDEYLRIGQTTSRKALQHFCQGVIKQFEGDYLRSPTDEDIRRILYQNNRRGFHGMIGSIDCMHWEWKNCPMAWKAQYAGRSKNATLIPEVVADQDLWIWHAFFGMPGSCNDLNVLYRSSVFDDVLQGRSPPINFSVNGHQYNLGYYLADGIYPRWPTFIQGITHLSFKKTSYSLIDKQQLGKTLNGPSEFYKLEDERQKYTRVEVLRQYYEEDRPQRTTVRSGPSTSAMVNNDEPFEYNVGRPPNIEFDTYLQRRIALCDRETHLSLKQDLVEHIWQNPSPLPISSSLGALAIIVGGVMYNHYTNFKGGETLLSLAVFLSCIPRLYGGIKFYENSCLKSSYQSHTNIYHLAANLLIGCYILIDGFLILDHEEPDYAPDFYSHYHIDEKSPRAMP
ncbi:uncharacterized protein LOC110727632 [Chenopodium quinoa]|uniref:uncharacterized protein LOC110727632 n=1 Tax=Chenopodium quinoa TaxID=63459 RepID=UPI000B78394C|nr:uncharacterized protein LOC110727632 [Chenopodium quinoa]